MCVPSFPLIRYFGHHGASSARDAGRSLKSLKSLEMTQARGHKKNRPRAASSEEPPLTDNSPAAAASKSCEGYLSRLAKAEAVSSMPR